MYGASDLRKGLKIEVDGAPYVITDFQFSKPGKGQAIYNCRMKNLINGTTLQKSYRSNDKVAKPALSNHVCQFSYANGDEYVFLDEHFEQITLTADHLGEQRFFLVADMDVELLYFQDKPIDITLPTFVEKVIVETEPGVRGDTATNVTKPARIEGGYEIQVPLFINQGDTVRIDTRTGGYAERVATA